MKRSLLSWSHFSKIIVIQSLLICLAITVFGFGLRYYLEHHYLAQVHRNMQDLLSSLEHQLPTEIDANWCRTVARDTKFRLTVIATRDGHVLCDTVYDAKSMQPLLERPEVQNAIKSESKFGSQLRFSPTMTDNAYYGTKYIERSAVVLRVGSRLSDLSEMRSLIDRALLLFGVVLIIALSLILYFSGRRVFFPMANALVEKTTRALGEDFVANATHELKTPLTSIKGFAETMLSDIDQKRPVEREFVEIVLQDSNRLLGLVNDILELSSLDAQSVRLHREPIDVKNVTEAVLARLEKVYGGKKHRIRTSYAVQDWVADADRITQILMNVIGNAQKYCPEHSEIEVDWSLRGEQVVLTVSDNGPGIPEDELARIFERFYRGGTGREALERGSGLGLAIVKNLVALHGGAIEIESTMGKGSQFRLSFPRA